MLHKSLQTEKIILTISFYFIFNSSFFFFFFAKRYTVVHYMTSQLAILVLENNKISPLRTTNIWSYYLYETIWLSTQGFCYKAGGQTLCVVVMPCPRQKCQFHFVLTLLPCLHAFLNKIFYYLTTDWTTI